jgi:hypothetical protein
MQGPLPVASPTNELPRELILVHTRKLPSLSLIAESNVKPPSKEEVDVTRHREITSKAVSAILLLVLKWFKASRRSLCIMIT